ncbi:MAG TPA: amidohydrolase family protein [Pirellulaceae bacterium]|nr:amidohydrolase family protein [Pirellulaceae bacterium]HMO92309.1 amidohydrolase family protein [Pirellulaceae bacterium]HMP69233.1 amidohydrolase family protein [Pirellulaceae bacterium]
MRIKSSFNPVIVTCFLIFVSQAYLHAQDGGRGRGAPQPIQSPATEQSDEANDREKDATNPTPKKSNLLAIVGGDVYTVTGEVIRRGIVLIENGKIKAVGRGIEIPHDAEVIDASGQVVTPGFVAITMSNIGVRGNVTGNNRLEDALDPYDRNIKYALGVGITTGCIELAGGRGQGRRFRDGEEQAATEDVDMMNMPKLSDDGEPNDVTADPNSIREVTLDELRGYTLRDGEPEHRYLGIDPEFGEYVTESQLDYGIENTQMCPCCGLPILPTEPITPAPPSQEQPRRFAAIKMSYGNLGDMLIKENVFYSPAPGGLTGALNRHNWRRDVRQAREAMEKAAADAAGRAQGQAPAGGNQADSRDAMRQRMAAAASGNRAGGANALTPLLKKEVSLRITANTVNEIRDMIALAEELDYNLVIDGGIEAWLVASELSKTNVPVIFTPRQRRDPRVGEDESSGSSIESTGIFESNGVGFAVASLSPSISLDGIAGRDLTSLPLEAAFAVRGGASNNTALEAITIVPARMMGLQDRIGSIEVGKDADLLILNGHPLDYRSYVETAIVAGKVCYERPKDRVFPVYDRR